MRGFLFCRNQTLVTVAVSLRGKTTSTLKLSISELPKEGPAALPSWRNWRWPDSCSLASARLRGSFKSFKKRFSNFRENTKLFDDVSDSVDRLEKHIGSVKRLLKGVRGWCRQRYPWFSMTLFSIFAASSKMRNRQWRTLFHQRLRQGRAVENADENSSREQISSMMN